MCKCITEVQDRIVVDQPFEELKVTSAKILNRAFIFSKSEYRMTGEIEVEAEGRKRPVKKSIVFSFCPICGNPYDK